MAMRNYTRWVEHIRRDLSINLPDGRTTPGPRYLVADILGASYDLSVDEVAGTVVLDFRDLRGAGGDVSSGDEFTPDEARMLGVRLIEGAALADGDRAVRRAPEES